MSLPTPAASSTFSQGKSTCSIRRLVLFAVISVMLIGTMFALLFYSPLSDNCSVPPVSKSSSDCCHNLHDDYVGVNLSALSFPPFIHHYADMTPYPRPAASIYNPNPFPIPKFDRDDGLRIGISVLARMESNYITHWVKYNLALGFDRIVVYDNDRSPTYAKVLREEGLACCVYELEFGKRLPPAIRKSTDDAYKIIVKHMKKTDVPQGATKQETQLQDFQFNHMLIDGFTHASVLDVDEYIQLNGRRNIREFVNYSLTDEYGTIDQTCGSITMAWAFYGDGGLYGYSPEPLPIRFACANRVFEPIGKTIFRVDSISKLFIHFHFLLPDPDTRPVDAEYAALVKEKQNHTRAWRECDTENRTIDMNGVNHDARGKFIQLNHYHFRTFPEYLFKIQRARIQHTYKYAAKTYAQLNFRKVNSKNEVYDPGARQYYLQHVVGMTAEEARKHPLPRGFKCPLPWNEHNVMQAVERAVGTEPPHDIPNAHPID